MSDVLTALRLENRALAAGLHLAPLDDLDLARIGTEAILDLAQRPNRKAEGGERLGGWADQVQTLADAYAPRPAMTYLVEALLPVPSVSLLVGPSGVHKSNLLMDLAACLAGGLPWLSPPPNGDARPFQTTQCPTLWYNADNPTPVLHDRFQAFGLGHGLPEAAPLFYFSFPDPPLIATRKASVAALKGAILSCAARLVIIDCLAAVRGDTDENSSDMAAVLTPLRRLTEECGIALVLIHHENKIGGYRGSTVIENAVDFSLLVHREPFSQDVEIRPGKMRHAEIKPFAASFSYEHKPGSSDLARARFFGLRVDSGNEEEEIEAAILDFIAEHPGANMTAIKKEIQACFEAVGLNRVSRVVVRLKSKGKVRECHGPRNAKEYRLAQ